MDAFIHSRALESKVVGTVYDNLFHVSDWFPTLLDMTKSVEYAAPAGYALRLRGPWVSLLCENLRIASDTPVDAASAGTRWTACRTGTTSAA